MIEKPKIFDLVLNNAYMLNDRMRHLEFKLLNHAEKFQHIPGQFISLLFEHNSELIRRNFSIASSPNNSNLIEIAVTHVVNGFASTKLHNMQLGATIKGSGPFGIFLINQENNIPIKRYILVATGTGVTPYRAMLPTISDLINNHNIEFLVLLGVRNKLEALYAKDFIEFQKQHSNNFKFILCYSRENSIPIDLDLSINISSGVYECQGYVQNKLDQLNINSNDDIIYLCGNPNMVDESLTILEKYNLPRNRIKREKYISTK